MNLYLLFVFGGHELNHVTGLNRASADLITVYVWCPSPLNFFKFLRPNSGPTGAKIMGQFWRSQKMVRPAGRTTLPIRAAPIHACFLVHGPTYIG
jgi:hypothetical protein